MSMTANRVSEVSIMPTKRHMPGAFPISILKDISVGSSPMYTLRIGEYKYGVEVGGVIIPAADEMQAKLIAKQMASLIMDVALEARHE